MNGMKKLVKFLDIQLNDSSTNSLGASNPGLRGQQADNLFDDIEVTEDILNILELVENDQITDIYLQSIHSIHHLTMAFKRLILTHEPIIPYQYYDHFLSPVANYDKLITQINKSTHYFFDYIMNFLSKLVLNPNILIPVKYLSKTLGIYLLRAENLALYQRNDVDDMNHRQEVFLKLTEKYCQIQRQNQTFKLVNEPSSANPTSTTAAATPLIAAPPATIQDRSIKVSFLNSNNKPSQEELQEFFSHYGNVINVGLKEKLAVILFADVEAALRCVEEEVSQRLGNDFKIKYLGSKTVLDLTQSSNMADITQNSAVSSVPVDLSEPLPPQTQSLQHNDTAVTKEFNLSSLPRPTTKVKTDVNTSFNDGIAAHDHNADRNESIATVSTTPIPGPSHAVTAFEDSFRLAKQQPEESLGIIDVSAISRAEDHNLTKVTLIQGETPVRPTNPTQHPSMLRMMQAMKSPSPAPALNNNYKERDMPSHVRQNSSFISDSGSDTSEDIRKKGSLNTQNAQPLQNHDSFISRDESVSLIDLEDRVHPVPLSLQDRSAGGWKTAQTTPRTSSQPPLPPVSHQTESSDENSLNNSSSPSNNKERTQLSAQVQQVSHSDSSPISNTSKQRAIKTIQVATSPTTPRILSTKEEREDENSSEVEDEQLKSVSSSKSFNQFPSDYLEVPATKRSISKSRSRSRSRSRRSNSEEEVEGPEVRMSEDVDTSRRGRDRRRTREVGRMNRGSDQGSATDTHFYDVTTTAATMNNADNATTTTSSKVFRHFSENELLHRIHYLEAKCAHYELSVTQYKEISEQNESLFRQQLIQSELRQQQLSNDYHNLQQELTQLKKEMFNKTIYISSLESMKESLEAQLRQIQQKTESQSLSTILSQKKLLDHLQSHYSDLQETHHTLESQMKEMQEQQLLFIQENLELKEELLKKKQVIKQLSKQVDKNDFEHHYPSSPAINKDAVPLAPRSTFLSDEEDDDKQEKKLQEDRNDREAKGERNEEKLALLTNLSHNELKNYLSKVSMEASKSGMNRYSMERSLNTVLDRSDLTKRILPPVPTNQFQMEPQLLSNLPTNSPEIIDENEIPLSNNDTDPNTDEPKLSYSAQILLSYEKNRIKYSSEKHQPSSFQTMRLSNPKDNEPIHVHSSRNLSPAIEREETGKMEDIYGKKQQETTSNAYAMKNYLTELTVYGKPRQQMTYYNHLKGNLLSEDQKNRSDNAESQSAVVFNSMGNANHNSQAHIPPPVLTPQQNPPNISLNLSSGHSRKPPLHLFSESEQTLVLTTAPSTSALPSLYTMNEDLRNLTQSILPTSSSRFTSDSIPLTTSHFLK